MVDLETGYFPGYLREAKITPVKGAGSSTPETIDDPDHYFTILPPEPHHETVLVGHVNIQQQKLMLRVNTLGPEGGNGEIQWLEIPQDYHLTRKDASHFNIVRAIAASFGYRP